MKFLFKFVINLSFFVILLSSHTLLASEGTTVFLLPEGSEDPLNLVHFLHRQAPRLIPFYEQIQVAKAAADTKTLLLVNKTFNTLGESEGNWQNLASRLTQEVKGDPVELWPGQSAQQCIGSVLFYPQELIGNDDSDLLCYPGLAASLAISADMGNPVAIYQLSQGYPDLARECRREPQDVDCEREIDAQDSRQSDVLKTVALQIFEQAMVTNKVAEFYVRNSAYEKRKIGLEEFAAYLHSTDLPQAYCALGRLYEHKHLSAHKNQPDEPDEDQLAYMYYRKALRGGYQEAIFGIHRLFDELEVESKEKKSLYEQGGGAGLFLAAGRLQREGDNPEEVKSLYLDSGKLGRLRSFITVGNEILSNHLPSDKPEREAISYYLEADRPGYAAGSRNIYASPRLCPTRGEKLDILKSMINYKYLKGYEWALGYLGSEGRYLEEDFHRLLVERGKILAIVNSIEKPS